MITSPLSISRRHVLGDLYGRCENVVSIPVFMNDPEGELIGYVDEGLGKYADAFCFHVSEDICKKLSAGRYTYSFNYDYADDDKSRRIRLTNICLTSLKGVEPPVSRAAAKLAV